MTPVLLPGGKAMVRSIGGGKKLIVDADECCCGQGTTTTTPVAACPSSGHCEQNCEDIYVTVLAGAGCGGEGTYTFRWHEGCTWWANNFADDYPGDSPANFFATLSCVGAGGAWEIQLYRRSPFLLTCIWRKQATADSCPEGTYWLFYDLYCETCDESATVYSEA